MKHILGLVPPLFMLVHLSGCPENRKIGESCISDDQCASGFCYEQCLDPDEDADADGITNADEKKYGSNALNPDSDGDGLFDGEEYGSFNGGNTEPPDGDGDGLIDAAEAIDEDSDGDCYPDQFDPDNGVPNEAPADTVAKCAIAVSGPCDGRVEDIGVSCAVVDDAFVVTCDYTLVDGYSSAEECGNAIDDNCDGVVDEGCVPVPGPLCPDCDDFDACTVDTCVADVCEHVSQAGDLDGDGTCDGADVDDDNDGVPDADDACPAGATGWTSAVDTDLDGDGCQDSTEDDDDDDDGSPDVDDCDPVDPNTYPGAPPICDGKLNDCSAGPVVHVTAADGIFVSASLGADGNPGTPEAPLRSLAEAVTAARDTGIDVIYVGTGTYTDAIVVDAIAVAIRGGFDGCDWDVQDGVLYPTSVVPAGAAATATNAANLTLEHLELIGSGATSAVGIEVTTGSTVTCGDCSVTASDATDASIGALLGSDAANSLRLSNSAVVTGEASNAIAVSVTGGTLDVAQSSLNPGAGSAVTAGIDASGGLLVEVDASVIVATAAQGTVVAAGGDASAYVWNSVLTVAASGSVDTMHAVRSLGGTTHIVNSLLEGTGDATLASVVHLGSTSSSVLANNLLVLRGAPGTGYGLELADGAEGPLAVSNDLYLEGTATVVNRGAEGIIDLNDCATIGCWDTTDKNTVLGCAASITGPPWALPADSPCIDRGSTSPTDQWQALETDRNGDPRSVALGGNGAWDIGPDEVGAASCALGSDCDDADPCTLDSCTTEGLCANAPDPAEGDLDSDGWCDAVDPPACDDGVQNGEESDLDCGGNCAPCANGEGCSADTDCTSGYCDQGTSQCTTPTCSDLVVNGDETDQDCGGSCPKCAEGAGCAVASDCQTGSCTGSVCVSTPSCQDILEAGGSTGDGTYVVDPDGVGGAAAFPVTCDMTTEGGGWTCYDSDAVVGAGGFVVNALIGSTCEANPLPASGPDGGGQSLCRFDLTVAEFTTVRAMNVELTSNATQNGTSTSDITWNNTAWGQRCGPTAGIGDVRVGNGLNPLITAGKYSGIGACVNVNNMFLAGETLSWTDDEGVSGTRDTTLRLEIDQGGVDGEGWAWTAGSFCVRDEVLIAGDRTQGAAGAWEDGSYALSCEEYRSPTDPFYAWTPLPNGTEEGYYLIDPDGDGADPIEVFCDAAALSGG